MLKSVGIILLLINWLCIVSMAQHDGRCMMRGVCKHFTRLGQNKAKNCAYDGPPVAITNVTYLKTMSVSCPDLVAKRKF